MRTPVSCFPGSCATWRSMGAHTSVCWNIQCAKTGPANMRMCFIQSPPHITLTRAPRFASALPRDIPMHPFQSQPPYKPSKGACKPQVVLPLLMPKISCSLYALCTPSLPIPPTLFNGHSNLKYPVTIPTMCPVESEGAPQAAFVSTSLHPSHGPPCSL